MALFYLQMPIYIFHGFLVTVNFTNTTPRNSHIISSITLLMKDVTFCFIVRTKLTEPEARNFSKMWGTQF